MAPAPQAAEAAFTYLILATLGFAFVLEGIGLIYMLTGHLNIGFAGQELGQVWPDYPHTVLLAVSFVIIGFGVKAAVFPLHVWLPDAHAPAPSPASAILSGLAVKGYLLCLLKFLYGVFGGVLLRELAVHRILTLLGVAGIIAGSLLALTQEELKRRLAYSTVAQVGYLVLGGGLLNATGLAGALFYLASHAVIKATPVFGGWRHPGGDREEQDPGVGGGGPENAADHGRFHHWQLRSDQAAPVLRFHRQVVSLVGGLEAGMILPVVAILAGSVLCAAYLLPVIRTAYFRPAPAVA